MSDLAQQKCEPCTGATPRMGADEAEKLKGQLDAAWTLQDEKLSREFKFKDFKEALAFVNRVGEIAEEQGHHPDIQIHGWNNVRLDVSTHDIDGMSRNDFILAARVDRL